MQLKDPILQTAGCA